MSDTSSRESSGSHANARTIERLYAALRARDGDAMAACYAERAKFRDIAFQLDGREAIRGMWRMVCSKQVDSTISEIKANADTGSAHWVACYRFGRHSRPVVNDTHAKFRFREGKITEHIDEADAYAWATQAYGLPLGHVLAVVGPLRRFGAGLKLKRFLRDEDGSR